MKKLFLLCFTPLLLLSSCGGGGSGSSGSSAYSQLSSDERAIYNPIKNSLGGFYNPASVTLVTVYQKAIVGRYVNIKAKNSYGSYVTNCYFINGSSLQSRDPVSGYSVDSSISVSKINAALNEYKKQQGYTTLRMIEDNYYDYRWNQII